MAGSSNPVLEEEMAAAMEALGWGTCPRLYLSYGMLAMKGRRPALTDAVEATSSFTVLSPPLGLDFFAVLDGRGLGAAAAGVESERLLALLRDVVAQLVYLELRTDHPWFLNAGTSRDAIVGWWATTIKVAFRVFHKEVAARHSQGEHGHGEDDAPAATAIVVLVHEKYLVVSNCSASKAVLSRGGEIVELSSGSQDMGDDNKSVENTGEGRMAEATSNSMVATTSSKSKLATSSKQTTTTSKSKLATTSKLTTAPCTTTDASGSSVLAPVAADAVDVVAVEWEARDEFLILASAAFWEKVTPAAACAHLRQRLGSTSRVRITVPPETHITNTEDWATLLAEELAKKAVDAGSQDNVSVGLIVFSNFWAGVSTPYPGTQPTDTGPRRSKRKKATSSRFARPNWACKACQMETSSTKDK